MQQQREGWNSPRSRRHRNGGGERGEFPLVGQTVFWPGERGKSVTRGAKRREARTLRLRRTARTAKAMNTKEEV